MHLISPAFRFYLQVWLPPMLVKLGLFATIDIYVYINISIRTKNMMIHYSRAELINSNFTIHLSKNELIFHL